MKRGFVMRQPGYLISAMVPDDAPSLLTVGTKILVTRRISYGEATIRPTEVGEVAHVYDDGGVEVRLALTHRGLHDWHNHLLLEPFDTDDILSSIIFFIVDRASLVA